MALLYVRAGGSWKQVTPGLNAGSDPAGPAMSSLVVTPAADTVTITFNTNVLSWRVIRWGTSSGNLPNSQEGNSFRTDHFIQLTSLTPSTTYYYQLTLTDEQEDVTVEAEVSFTTLADNTASPQGPAVSGLSVAPTSSDVTLTFTTDVPAWRVIKWGTEANNLSNTQNGNAYRTDHFIKLYDLTPSTTYYYQLTLTDESGSGITQPSVQSFVTEAAVVAPGGPLLRWAPPVLDNPVIWTPTSTDRNRTFPIDRDVQIVAPSTPIDWKDGIVVTGGRNIVAIGLEFEFNTNHYGSTGDAGLTNRCIRFNGGTVNTPRVIHLEGWKMHGTELFEGINHDGGDETATIFRMQNMYVGKLRWKYPPGSTSGHHGGDAFQPWDGPYRLQIDYFTAIDQTYQCLWLQPRNYYSGPLGRWDFSHVDIVGDAGGHSQLFAMNGAEPAASNRVLDQVYVQPGGSKTWSQSIKGEWINLNQGRPANGSFVDPNTVGIGYVSPGYL